MMYSNIIQCSAANEDPHPQHTPGFILCMGCIAESHYVGILPEILKLISSDLVNPGIPYIPPRSPGGVSILAEHSPS